MDKEELRTLLSDHGKTREWLARETGVSMSTVNNWLSTRRITDRSAKDIRAAFDRLGSVSPDAQPAETTSPITAHFSLDQVGKIHRAMKARRYSDIQDFFQDAVIDYTDRILSEQQARTADRSGNIQALPATGPNVIPIPVAAETPSIYGSNEG